MIPSIVQKLESIEDEIRALMKGAEERAERQRREWEEAREGYRREEDKRRAAQALAESKKQFADIMEKWVAATAVDRFFLEAESRLEQLDAERRAHLTARLALAKAIVGPRDPFDYLEEWLAPGEQYQSRYPQDEGSGSGAS